MKHIVTLPPFGIRAKFWPRVSCKLLFTLSIKFWPRVSCKFCALFIILIMLSPTSYILFYIYFLITLPFPFITFFIYYFFSVFVTVISFGGRLSLPFKLLFIILWLFVQANQLLPSYLPFLIPVFSPKVCCRYVLFRQVSPDLCCHATQ